MCSIFLLLTHGTGETFLLPYYTEHTGSTLVRARKEWRQLLLQQRSLDALRRKRRRLLLRLLLRRRISLRWLGCVPHLNRAEQCVQLLLELLDLAVLSRDRPTKLLAGSNLQNPINTHLGTLVAPDDRCRAAVGGDVNIAVRLSPARVPAHGVIAASVPEAPAPEPRTVAR